MQPVSDQARPGSWLPFAGVGCRPCPHLASPGLPKARQQRSAPPARHRVRRATPENPSEPALAKLPWQVVRVLEHPDSRLGGPARPQRYVTRSTVPYLLLSAPVCPIFGFHGPSAQTARSRRQNPGVPGCPNLPDASHEQCTVHPLSYGWPLYISSPRQSLMILNKEPLLVLHLLLTWISVGSVMAIPFRASTRGPFSPSCAKPSTRGAADSALGELLRDTLTIVIWGARSGREEKWARWRRGRRTRAGREQAGAEKTAGRSEPPCAHVLMLALIGSIVRRPMKRSGFISLLAARTACIAGG